MLISKYQGKTHSLPLSKLPDTYIMPIQSGYVNFGGAVNWDINRAVLVRRPPEIQIFDAVSGTHPGRRHTYCYPYAEVDLQQKSWNQYLMVFYSRGVDVGFLILNMFRMLSCLFTTINF